MIVRVALGAMLLVSAGASAQSVTAYHVFEAKDGIYPQAVAMDAVGDVYGSTETGGPGGGTACSSAAGTGCGTVFGIAPGGVFSVIVAFNAVNGLSPNSPPQVRNGQLIDTSPESDTNHGAVFSVKTDGTGFRQLHMFLHPANGSNPYGPFVVTPDRTLYGTTIDQVGQLGPVLYKLSPSGVYSILYRFPLIAGGDSVQIRPLGVFADSAGHLFGATQSGSPGYYDCGTIYEFDAGTGTYTNLINLSQTPGCFAQLAGIDSAGNLYGYNNSQIQGYDGEVSLFEMRKTATGYQYQTIWSLPSSADVSFTGMTLTPHDGLIGVTVPTTSAPAGVYGSLFQFKGGIFTTLYTFTDLAVGSRPVGAPVVASDGTIYGAAAGGGDLNCAFDGCGTIFRYAP